MMRLRYWSAFLAAAALGAAVPAAALTKAEIDARWQRLTAAQEARAAGEAKAAELRRTLDGQILEGSLYSLWRRCVRGEGPQRLQAAWSVLRVHVPGGDPSRWDEVGSFELPSETPRAFMVIDALYAALIELPRREGGEWLAAGLLRDFARSPHGRYDFLGVCPAPVAEAVADIVARTGLSGNWRPRRVVGRLPIARPVHGTVTDSYARGEDMQFLDGAGIPAGNGFYAWDRPSGRIYRISLYDRKLFFIPGF